MLFERWKNAALDGIGLFIESIRNKKIILIGEIAIEMKTTL